MDNALTIAMVFPGQGSRSQGVQAVLAPELPFVPETYAVAFIEDPDSLPKALSLWTYFKER